MCRPSSRGSSLQRDFAHRPSPLTLSLYAFTACEVGFPGSKCIDLEDRTIPTHTDSPWQSGGARKELGVLREWITFSICRGPRAEAPCVKSRVVESGCRWRSTFMLGLPAYDLRSRHAVHGSWIALAGPAPLRRRRDVLRCYRTLQ